MIGNSVRYIALSLSVYSSFDVSLTLLAMKSRSHADYVISHAFQLKQSLRK